MSLVSSSVVCSEFQIRFLERIISDPKEDPKYVLRAKIILSLNRKERITDIASKLETNADEVTRVRNRFLAYGLDGLGDDAEIPTLSDRTRKASGSDTVDDDASAAPQDDSMTGKYIVPEGILLNRKTDIFVYSVVSASDDKTRITTNASGTHIEIDRPAGGIRKGDVESTMQSFTDALFENPVRDIEQAEELIDQKADPVPEPKEYLQQMMGRFVSETPGNHYALIFSQDPDMNGRRFAGICVDNADNRNEFLRAMKRLFDKMQKQGTLNVVGWKVRDEVMRIMDGKKESLPFVWTRHTPTGNAAISEYMVYQDRNGKSWVESVDVAGNVNAVSEVCVTDMNLFRQGIGEWEKGIMDASSRLNGKAFERLIDENTDESVKKKTSRPRETK